MVGVRVRIVYDDRYLTLTLTLILTLILLLLLLRSIETGCVRLVARLP